MYKFLIQQARKNKIYIKYFIAGITGAAVHLFILTVFYRFLGVSVVISTSLGFVVAFFVSFYLQKFWTFRDNGRDEMLKQMMIYFIVGAVNMTLNASLMYWLVEKLSVWYLLSQVMVSGVIAIESFLIYKFVIFKKQKQPS